MAKIKDYLIGIKEQLENDYDREFTLPCDGCNGSGFKEVEIMGDYENGEWDVVGTKRVVCDECF